MPRKLIGFHREDERALEQLIEDKFTTLQELMDEAVADLLKKHGRPTVFREALKKSVSDGVEVKTKEAVPRRSASRRRKRR